MSTLVRVYELRDEAPAVAHTINPAEKDATFCEEFIGGPVLEDGFVSEHEYVTQACPVCVVLAGRWILDNARSEAARELGVDESEVF